VYVSMEGRRVLQGVRRQGICEHGSGRVLRSVMEAAVYVSRGGGRRVDAGSA
jgi:hypothetical protein